MIHQDVQKKIINQLKKDSAYGTVFIKLEKECKLNLLIHMPTKIGELAPNWRKLEIEYLCPEENKYVHFIFEAKFDSDQFTDEVINIERKGDTLI